MLGPQDGKYVLFKSSHFVGLEILDGELYLHESCRRHVCTQLRLDDLDLPPFSLPASLLDPRPVFRATDYEVFSDSDRISFGFHVPSYDMQCRPGLHYMAHCFRNL